jgi:hypothetical protein
MSTTSPKPLIASRPPRSFSLFLGREVGLAGLDPRTNSTRPR